MEKMNKISRLQNWLDYSDNRVLQIEVKDRDISISMFYIDEVVYCYNYKVVDPNIKYLVICDTNKLEEMIHKALNKWEELYDKDI